MTVVDRVSGSEESAPTALLVDAARGFVPRIRQLARQMELAGRLDEELVDDMEAAGLFSVVVPKRWGGAGLGPHELNKIVEITATGDVSTAWVTGFYNLHNWFLCRYPREVQEELFADRASVRTAAILSSPGSAVRADGALRISGRWGYATGMLHASHALVPVLVDGEMYWAIVPREQLEVFDDWDVAAMAATGSVTIEAKDALVPETWAMPFGKMMSATDHDGVFHDEDVMRMPFSVLKSAISALHVGALDAAVEMTRERLFSSAGVNSPRRIDRPLARMRWVSAYQTARIMHLVLDASTEEAIEIALRGTPQTLEEEADSGLHGATILQTARDTLRELVDGNGSSGYRSDNHLRRMSADIAMLTTHAVHGEYDVMMDRYARWLLGMGLAPGDPGARMT
ncbi:acyl-CoA dehydrogenase family protein [Mycolicibacterium palauense]|uniref:acyl-CoA dehydrogenase family protein n=1 Tax=Mycolicibacterium palauense TaxID=2034511 RepID=UPI000BFF0972|nr:acyl-CoA dehydrogenase family protein [Mycolicibacterium palauense]